MRKIVQQQSNHFVMKFAGIFSEKTANEMLRVIKNDRRNKNNVKHFKLIKNVRQFEKIKLLNK